MESTYQDLARQISDAARLSGRSRFLVAVAGAPGSGKTTIARVVVRLLNDPGHGASATTTAISHPQAVAVSMDGFHLPRSALDQFPNREEAHARRGAPWTFDVKSILTLLTQLRDSVAVAAGARSPIFAPTFDHAIKDPVAKGVVIPEDTSIVIVEGNYLLLDEDDWREISQLVDLKVFIDVDSVEARRRVSERHVVSGIVTSLADGEKRFDSNDSINGNLIREKMIKPDIVVESVSELSG